MLALTKPLGNCTHAASVRSRCLPHRPGSGGPVSTRPAPATGPGRPLRHWPRHLRSPLPSPKCRKNPATRRRSTLRHALNRRTFLHCERQPPRGPPARGHDEGTDAAVSVRARRPPVTPGFTEMQEEPGDTPLVDAATRAASPIVPVSPTSAGCRRPSQRRPIAAGPASSRPRRRGRMPQHSPPREPGVSCPSDAGCTRRTRPRAAARGP